MALALCLALQEEIIDVTVATKDGNSLQGTTDVRELRVESSLGVVTVKLKDAFRIKITDGVAAISMRDGNTFSGKLQIETWSVKASMGEFKIKIADLASVDIRGVRQKEDLPCSAQKSFALPFSANAMLASSDGKKLMVSGGRGKLVIVDVQTFSADREIALGRGDNSAAMALSPSGGVRIASGRLVAAVDPQAGKVLQSFEIETSIASIYALDEDTVIAATNPGFALISLSKQGVVHKIGFGQASSFLAVPSLGKLLTAGSLLLLPDETRGRKECQRGQPVRFVSEELRGIVDPEARFIATKSGPVYRIGKSIAGDLVELAAVERHHSAFVLAKSRRLLAFTQEGFVKEYSTVTWELVKSWRLGLVAWHVHADEPAGVFYAVTTAVGRYDGAQLQQFELPK